MEDLEKEAKQHFEKLMSTLAYLRGKYEEKGQPVVKKEIDALEFVLQYAKEALAQRDIRV